MFTSYFLAFLLAHLASDFVFQCDTLVDMKEKPKTLVLGLFIHTMIVLGTNLIIFRLAFEKWLLGITLVVAATHFVIDLAKSKYNIRCRISREARALQNTSNDQFDNNRERNYLGWIFLADQTIHIATIFVAAWYLCAPPALDHYIQFYNLVIEGQLTIVKSLDVLKKGLLIWILLCLAISVSNVIIKLLLEGLKKDMGSSVKSGRYIGGIERLLTILAIIAGAWAGIAVIYGSKTAIRFTQVKENPEFAEYYILGTLLSALFGVLIGIAAKVTLGF